jgi:hypothetical protein
LRKYKRPVRLKVGRLREPLGSECTGKMLAIALGVPAVANEILPRADDVLAIDDAEDTEILARCQEPMDDLGQQGIGRVSHVIDAHDAIRLEIACRDLKIVGEMLAGMAPIDINEANAMVSRGLGHCLVVKLVIHRKALVVECAARYVTRIDIDWNRPGCGWKTRAFFDVTLSEDRVRSLILREGAELRVFPADQIRDLRVAPYDAFGLWLHINHERVG